MTIVGAGAALLLLAGVLSGAPGLVLLGLLSLVTTGLSGLWSRRGLDCVRYERRLGADRAVVGDQLELELAVENAKLLPLAWLATDDYATDGLVVIEHPLAASDRPGLGVLRNVWTLAPFERVVRHFHLAAARRGRYRFEMVRLAVADLFGRGVASAEQDRPATLIVRPRSVPVQGTGGQFVPLGSRRARQGLLEDPVLFAGVRPFQPGDPRRRIHQRASARLGWPVSRRFEPSTARHVLVALDVQTHPGPHWLLAYDDELVESLVVAAASLARRFLADGTACGLAANGWTYSLARTGFVAPHGGADQLIRIGDLLGRLSSTASVPFSHLLATLPARLPGECLVVTLSSRDPATFGSALRRLRSSGFEVRHIALGPRGPAWVVRARRLGIDARLARLEPDWRTSDALTVAG
ncbi:MAG: DUF58 domain-containing protein [Chloroflexota bacterium]